MIPNSTRPPTPPWPGDTSREPQNWSHAPFHKQLLLAVIFLLAFLLLDRSSTASQAWAGAPTWYLPVGLTLALLLYGGMRYLPLVLISTLVAAVVNYHRPVISWCGLPGGAVYIAYLGGMILCEDGGESIPSSAIRGRRTICPGLLSSAAIPGAFIGSLTCWGRLSRSV